MYAVCNSRESDLVGYRYRAGKKDVADTIGVAHHQIAGTGAEGNEAPVTANRGAEAVIVGLGAIASYRDPHSRGCAARRPQAGVADKDVRGGVGVVRHQIAGIGLEGDEAPVGANGSPIGIAEAVAVGLGTIASYRDPHSRGCTARRPPAGVADKDVSGEIGVARD